MSCLALPVIVFEDVGAIEAFRRSSQLLKRTWGEQVVFNFGIGLVGLLAALPAVALAGALVATGVLAVQIVAVAAAVVWVVLVIAVTSALSATSRPRSTVGPTASRSTRHSPRRTCPAPSGLDVAAARPPRGRLGGRKATLNPVGHQAPRRRP